MEVKEREPLLMCVTGRKGVGKTFTTTKMLYDYVKPNPKTGKKGRKVLIYDVNMEYTQFKTIGVKDIKRFAQSERPQVRRILPVDEHGQVLKIDEMVDTLNLILQDFRGGLLLLEDINRYMLQAKTQDIIGVITTCRHRDLDIICHYQSLSALDPRMWQNSNFVRFHSQMDDIERYKQRIPNFQMFKIAQYLVELQYYKKKNPRFFCFVSNDNNYITGSFSPTDFKYACIEWLKNNDRRAIKETQRKFGRGADAENKAINYLCDELRMKYFRGTLK
jgi:hypothetical protein